jgi:hypothetical protein
MDAAFLATQFEKALDYDSYLKTGTDEQQRRWQQAFDASRLTDAQAALLRGFVRGMRVLVVSGIWCGDCVQQCTLMQHIAAGNSEKIRLRFVDRDRHKELSSQLRINGGDRVPVVVFMAEDHELCGIYGERTLSRYRALARKQLGAACEIAIAPPNTDEAAATLQEWLDEFERIQLMLRISPRLRAKHGD